MQFNISNRISQGLIFCFDTILACLIGASIAHAQGLQAAHYKIVRLELKVNVHQDLTNEWEQTLEHEALSDVGAVNIGKYFYQYSQGYQVAEITEAYTIKADGRKIPVQADTIQRQLGVTTESGVSWPEASILQVTFPDLQKGDRTLVTVKGRDFKNFLPGWSAFHDTLPHNVDVDQYHARLEIPQGMDFQVQGQGMAVQSHQSGEKKVWEIQGASKAHLLDAGAVNIQNSNPRWMFSSFSDWEQLGRSFGQAFASRLTLNEDIRKLAHEIIQGEETTEGKARKIHAWLRRNVRYVAVYLGTGGWVPHELDWILKNRYGDCKDQSLLMIALLQSAGINATPALLRTQADYDLPELPVPWFDHCIVFIPELKRFVDPAASAIAWGALPMENSDKPVLVVDFDGKSRLDRTPPFRSEENRIEVHGKWQIHTDGSADLKLDIAARGQSAVGLQNQLRQIPDNMREAALNRWITDGGLRGTGQMSFTPVSLETQRQDLHITAKIQNLLPDPEAGAILPHPMLSNLGVYIISNIVNINPDTRRYAIECIPFSVREEFSVQYSKDFELLRVPKPVQISSDALAIRFEQHIVKNGNSVDGWREYSQSQAHHSCSPQQYLERQPVLSRILHSLRSNVLYVQSSSR
ncbi:DUF3857 domain-containing protein [Verminephrobacter aporrectodeae subsp. tuberculatae]|uniref:DUF3857 domain-containing transglutaminase family protein n=1 Tax=Verminephrobacter aporrectodeae TaxID=1110389 RepID=UPI0022375C1F|nr:DUF3857 and transglutaminase domain-containing protein [Verminephrobacter aporrectodeae]MCW5222352.1 DUF3857 domain-containing protein [Verminephrobacter aporrectodeae subsp. tuberculatae]MCW5287816.1 DUF3857 domain-containing protein [Verminephrobacter aporrectodeae subsp. tuberculatae]